MLVPALSAGTSTYLPDMRVFSDFMTRPETSMLQIVYPVADELKVLPSPTMPPELTRGIPLVYSNSWRNHLPPLSISPCSGANRYYSVPCTLDLSLVDV